MFMKVCGGVTLFCVGFFYCFIILNAVANCAKNLPPNIDAKIINLGKRVDSITFSLDGKRLYCICDPEKYTESPLEIFDVELDSNLLSITSISDLPQRFYAPASSCISPDGNLVAFIDETAKNVALCDLTTKKLFKKLPINSNGKISFITFSYDSNQLIILLYNVFKLVRKRYCTEFVFFDITSTECKKKYYLGSVAAASMSLDRTNLFCIDRSHIRDRIVSFDICKPAGCFFNKFLNVYEFEDCICLRSVSINSYGTLILAAGGDKIVSLLDAYSGCCIHEFCYADRVSQAIFSPNYGERFAVCLENGTIIVYTDLIAKKMLDLRRSESADVARSKNVRLIKDYCPDTNSITKPCILPWIGCFE